MEVEATLFVVYPAQKWVSCSIMVAIHHNGGALSTVLKVVAAESASRKSGCTYSCFSIGSCEKGSAKTATPTLRKYV